MNQDNYLEEALKMRNLLEEFNEDHGVQPPTILGVREHVFTGSFSSLAWFMSNQETSFFAIQQRVLARPLKVRFHYGHPDVFDRIFRITRGGISKASRGINLSEDFFAAASTSAAYVTAPLWFLVISWLFAPFIFNPSGFEWRKIVDDWHDWMKWICSNGGSGAPATKSWESWWDEEQEHLLYTGILRRFWEIVLSLRFFLIQYWLVYHLHVSNGDTRRRVFWLSWLVIVVVVMILKTESTRRKKLSPHLQLKYRLMKLFLFVGFVVTLSLIYLFLNLTVGDIFICLLAFMPTGWALLSVLSISHTQSFPVYSCYL